MLKLRIIYNEEFVAFCRLFFLTENRNLEHNEYKLEDGYFVLFSAISEQLNSLLRRFEVETIWSPLWVEGVARGLFSDHADIAANLMGLDNIPEIPWTKKFGPIIFIDRNFYPKAIDILKNIPSNLVYGGDIDPKRLITGKVSSSGVNGYYQLPSEIIPTTIDFYLQGWNFFVLPVNESIQDLNSRILENYKRTRSKRVPGKRSILPFADLGYAITLDSADELFSLLGMISVTNSNSNSQDKLYFPPNRELQGDNASIWRYPVKVGKEDLFLELSYFRETGKLDPDYKQYRMFQINNLDVVKREFFISKHRL